MGREATALMRATPLPEMGCSIELFVAKARLAHHVYSANGNVTETEEQALATLLVSLAPSEADRRAARALGQTFVGAECAFLQGSTPLELIRKMQRSLGRESQHSVFLVLAMPLKFDPGGLSALEDLLTALQGHHHLCLTLAVAETPAVWMPARMVDGLVRSEPERVGATALEVFNILASVSAPTLAPCIDEFDIKEVLGPSEHPAQIVQAVWLAEDRKILLSDHAQNILRSCSAIVMAAPSSFRHLAEMRSLTEAMRSATSSGTVLHITMTGGLLARTAPSSVEVISIMCGFHDLPDPASA